MFQGGINVWEIEMSRKQDCRWTVGSNRGKQTGYGLMVVIAHAVVTCFSRGAFKGETFVCSYWRRNIRWTTCCYFGWVRHANITFWHITLGVSTFQPQPGRGSPSGPTGHGASKPGIPCGAKQYTNVSERRHGNQYNGRWNKTTGWWAP